MNAETALICARRLREALEKIEQDLSESIAAANALMQPFQASPQSGQGSQSEPLDIARNTSEAPAPDCNHHGISLSQTRTSCKSQDSCMHRSFALLLKMFGLGSPSMSKEGRFFNTRNILAGPIIEAAMRGRPIPDLSSGQAQELAQAMEARR